jgi:ribosome biogenesis GTPase / thiamine phosphate phosphatase
MARRNANAVETQENTVHLEDLGWNSFFESHFVEVNKGPLVPARVTEVLKGFHRVRCERGEYLAEVAGKIHYAAEARDDYPAVGDWVAIAPRPREGRARIECILPRRTKLARKVAGRASEEQIIACNLDTVFVVSSLNRDFNLRRIERYLALVWDSGARPVILLNKADLCEEAESCAMQVETVGLGTPVHLLCALAGTGVESIVPYLPAGATGAFVGSSGVGKSTIINRLLGKDALFTQPVRDSDDRGKHTTTSRQMILLPKGGIVVDTPGMRELQLLDNEHGVAQAFEDIETLARACKFGDCRHRGEPGCAVLDAIVDGSLLPERLQSFRKLGAEMAYLERKYDPQLARETKEKWKKIHKAMRPKPDLY